MKDQGPSMQLAIDCSTRGDPVDAFAPEASQTLTSSTDSSKTEKGPELSDYRADIQTNGLSGPEGEV